MAELAFLSTEVDIDEDGDTEISGNANFQLRLNSKNNVSPKVESEGYKAEVHRETVEICQSTVNPNDKVNCENFKIQKVIGKGGYGKVFLVQKVDGVDQGKLYAMKVLKKAKLVCNEKDKAHTVSERNILEMLRHPFIVKLHYAFQNMSNLYIVLEYCPGGELFSYLEREGALLENAACFYAAEIVLAIGHLHNLGIIYRDLKSENVLLDRHGHVKLTDFGLSKEGVRTTNTFCGTIEYMAPEIIKCEGHGKAVDWWSLGTLIYDMLSGGPPFSREDTREATTHKILTASLKFPPSFSHEVINLLRGLLKRDPRERLGGKEGVEEVKRHKFFRRYDINWCDVYNRRLKPPFRPKLTSESDVSMFSPNFTHLQPVVTPADNNRSIPSDMFQGFSYVARSVCDNGLRDSWTDQPVRNCRQYGSKIVLSTGRLRRVCDENARQLNRVHEKVLTRDTAIPYSYNFTCTTTRDVTNPQGDSIVISTNEKCSPVCVGSFSTVVTCDANDPSINAMNSNHFDDGSGCEPDVDDDEDEVEDENVPGAKHIQLHGYYDFHTQYTTNDIVVYVAANSNANSHSNFGVAPQLTRLTNRNEAVGSIPTKSVPHLVCPDHQNKVSVNTVVNSVQKPINQIHRSGIRTADAQPNVPTSNVASSSKCILM